MAPLTPAAKLVPVTTDIELLATKDADGANVVVRVRKLHRSEILVLMGGFPALQSTSDKEEREAERERMRLNPLSPEAVAHVQQSVALGRAMVVAASVEPRFHAPGQPVDGAADVAIIDDDDCAMICDKLLSLSGWNQMGESAENSALAQFPPQRQKGRRGGR